VVCLAIPLFVVIELALLLVFLGTSQGDIISMRGYDLLADAVDVGRQVIPVVREEVAKRDAALAAAAS
jgi:hypothetical protein